MQFFALFAAFGLAFWYGVKQIREQRLDSVATVLMYDPSPLFLAAHR
jgi:hypothetical protein